jgi:hypothetical protein
MAGFMSRSPRLRSPIFSRRNLKIIFTGKGKNKLVAKDEIAKDENDFKKETIK